MIVLIKLYSETNILNLMPDTDIIEVWSYLWRYNDPIYYYGICWHRCLEQKHSLENLIWSKQGQILFNMSPLLTSHEI